MKNTFKNTTIQNLSKKDKLSTEHIIPHHMIRNKNTINFLKYILELKENKETILYNIGKFLCKNIKNVFYINFLKEYEYSEIEIENIPTDEFDLLGIVYQYLNTKYENLSTGSFYTKYDIAYEMTSNLSFDNNENIIDFSCGSGSFLFSANIPYDRITGIDIDPISVMICKFNYFMKFPNTKIYPQIYESDFIEWFVDNHDKKYNYIVGNPPYGAEMNISRIYSNYIKTGESFSYFIELGYRMLKDGGLISYLVPESLLNVKRHVDIRDFILEKTNLLKIKKHDKKFSGVMSDIYQIEINKKKSGHYMEFIKNGNISKIKKELFKNFKNHIFTFITDHDISVIEKIKCKSPNNLKGSEFGIGVVTGDNKNKLLENREENSEPIYTGKDINKYILSRPCKYLIFDRKNLQQVAPDHIYRAPEKIIYKVINTKIKVSMDFSGSLTTNSANIILPKVKNNNIYSICLLLNSDLYTFLNQKLHGVVNKISKENLQNLYFPSFTEGQLQYIENMIKEYISGDIKENDLQEYVYNYFNITSNEISYIKSNIK